MKFKKKKMQRMRGTGTHGWGCRKKHRGKGSRGGFGMAGTGKRADTKKISILKKYGHAYYGKRGFNRPQKILSKSKTLNLFQLKKLNKLDIDLTKLGYTKLLGTGEVDKKYKIIVNQISKSAKEKIEKAGGEVTLK